MLPDDCIFLEAQDHGGRNNDPKADLVSMLALVSRQASTVGLSYEPGDGWSNGTWVPVRNSLVSGRGSRKLEESKLKRLPSPGTSFQSFVAERGGSVQFIYRKGDGDSNGEWIPV